MIQSPSIELLNDELFFLSRMQFNRFAAPCFSLLNGNLTMTLFIRKKIVDTNKTDAHHLNSRLRRKGSIESLFKTMKKVPNHHRSMDRNEYNRYENDEIV